MKDSNMPFISTYGVLGTFFFLLFSLIGRFLFPFGDEPDFIVRAPAIVEGEFSWWSPYSIFHDLLQKLDFTSECKIDANAMSAWAQIDTFSCTESLEQILIRLFITIVVVSPILYAIIFRKSFVALMFILNVKLSAKEWNRRLDVLSLTLIFPSIIYYLGIFAEEQFTLVLSLFIFLFWDFWILILLIFALLMTIDLGNSIVVLVFILFGYFFNFISKKFSVKIAFISMLSIILFAYIVGFSFLVVMENISFLAQKSDAIYNKGLTFENKYPVILRPIVTFMTGIFMTPSGIKVVALYFIYGFLFIQMGYKLNGYMKIVKLNTAKCIVFEKNYILFLSSLTLILFFVFLFPDYSFAKYYVFTIPFFILFALYVFNKNNVMSLFILSNIVIFINLLLFRF